MRDATSSFRPSAQDPGRCARCLQRKADHEEWVFSFGVSLVCAPDPYDGDPAEDRMGMNR
jgi:hypothetical protein